MALRWEMRSCKTEHFLLRYMAFDFHEACKNMKYENLELLMKQAQPIVDKFGYSHFRFLQCPSWLFPPSRKLFFGWCNRTNIDFATGGGTNELHRLLGQNQRYPGILHLRLYGPTPLMPLLKEHVRTHNAPTTVGTVGDSVMPQFAGVSWFGLYVQKYLGR